MEVDREAGLIYLLQRSQPPVSVWTPQGELVGAWDTEALGDPHSITLETRPDGRKFVWITDMAPPRPAGGGYGHCIKQFTTEGDLVGSIGRCGENTQGIGLDPVQFDRVTDIAFDSFGQLFVTDGDIGGLNNRVLKLTPTGEVVMEWSAPGNQPGSGAKEFNLPHDLHIDVCDRVWVADALNHRIQVIGNEGSFYGELSCFGDYGVYGIDLSAIRESPTGTHLATLFVTASPTDGGNRGTVTVFNVPMECSEPTNIGVCEPVTQWDIRLPPTHKTAMLHSVTADSDGKSIYLSELGGALPPQKWVEATPD